MSNVYVVMVTLHSRLYGVVVVDVVVDVDVVIVVVVVVDVAEVVDVVVDDVVVVVDIFCNFYLHSIHVIYLLILIFIPFNNAMTTSIRTCAQVTRYL